MQQHTQKTRNPPSGALAPFLFPFRLATLSGIGPSLYVLSLLVPAQQTVSSFVRDFHFKFVKIKINIKKLLPSRLD